MLTLKELTTTEPRKKWEYPHTNCRLLILPCLSRWLSFPVLQNARLPQILPINLALLLVDPSRLCQILVSVNQGNLINGG